MRPAAGGRRLLVLASVCVGAGWGMLLGGCGSDSSQPHPQAGFWGVVPQSSTSIEQLRRLKYGGINSVRIGIDWRAVMPTEGGTPRWRDVDGIVGDATRVGMFVLPYVYRSPAWVAQDENELPVRTAEQRRSWMAFVEDVVGRYGPGGAFWEQNPDLPEQPIRTWQIWNEPNFFYFAREPDPGRYARLVQISHTALAASDPGAELMLGGMFALPGEKPPQAYPAYRFLELMFARDPGLREIVDGVALHPYTQDFRNLPPILDQVRRALRRVGEGAVPLWITELGWGSQRGAAASQLEKGPRGQARQLGGAFRLLRNRRNWWRLRQVYWFTVADARDEASCSFCDSAGLFTSDFHPKPAWRTFERVARSR